MISITFDRGKLPAAGLSARAQNRIAVGAANGINKTAKSVVATMAPAIAQDATLKVGDVKANIAITEATPTRLSATIAASKKLIPLIKYRVRGPEPSRGRPGGVVATVFGQKITYGKAFIATVRGPLPNGVMSPGHRGVFVRRGRARLPIRQVYGPPLTVLFERHAALGERRRDEMLTKTVDHEVQYQLSKLK